MPIIYFTFSATETKNPGLLRILYRLKYKKNISLHEAMHLDMSEKPELIRDDPVTCVRYIDNRFRKMIKILQNQDGHFKEHFVDDHFSRNEFQARGSVHKHGIFYCRDAPVLDESDPESIRKCCEFADKIATCGDNPNNPLILYQRHAHKATCYKGRKNKLKHCRFNIPNFVMHETMILYPLKNGENSKISHSKNLDRMKNMMEQFFQNNILMNYAEMLEHLDLSHEGYILAIRNSLNHAELFLRRKSNEVAINAYNKIILTLLESNMDIQFVTDIYSCITHIVK
ncbi:hypothetical protein QAD02_013868 [Eretmocerus hayati]|uniref:Uncharacterized protein n=1 Tax=Eretmocerus hayati TaxID=131215 RepID=A0ACC2P3R9_9HYME|nr:hypothetical protein QAD02_013868 [Eretmocerus hayati]